MSYDITSGAEWVCDTIGKQANVFYHVIAKTEGVANQR